MTRFDEWLLCLSLQKALGRIRAIPLFIRVLGIDQLRDGIKRFTENTTDVMLVGGFILRRSRRLSGGLQFFLETGDRTTFITDEFLASCSPEWAQVLREAIIDWKPEEPDGTC